MKEEDNKKKKRRKILRISIQKPVSFWISETEGIYDLSKICFEAFLSLKMNK